MIRPRSLRLDFASLTDALRSPTLVALVTLCAFGLAVVAPASACLLAKRLRVVAPHLTEEEIQLYAHGNMTPLKVHYKLAAATACVGGQADIFTCDGVDLLGHLNLSEIGGGNGNDLWGWTDPVTGAEIAIIGRTNGTSFIDVSDPENPVYLGNLPSHSGSSSWRDIKTFADHAFVVADGQPHGIQVFDLTQLRGVTSPPVTFSATAHYDAIGSAHNIVINEATGFAYAVGSNTCSGGLYMVDVNTPTTPTFAGCFSADGYTHDAQCVIYNGPDSQHTGQEICFASNEDTLTIVDVSNKNTPAQLSRVDYTPPGNSHYAHQGWLTEDQQYFVFDDEFDEMGQGHNTRTYVWDVTDLDAPVLTGSWDAAGSSVDHNQYIRGNHTYQANYARGLRILELTDLGNAGLTEVAFFDTYPESDGNNFDGAWSTYPFFASGIVLVSDINRGLFILKPQTTDPNTAPAVNITAPANGSSSNVGDSVTFTGTANDAEDGDLSSSLSWNSSINGNIGSGASFSTTTLSAGSHTITASVIDSGGATGSSQISISVIGTGGGPQTAIYDAGLGVPACALVGSSCDSLALVDGRDGNGPEPNQPNTLDGCADGTSGSYHSDESNDRIVVSTLDSADMVEGATVRIDATVWAWTTPSADTLDLFYAADASNPTWVLIGSTTATVAGEQTLSATYTLPTGTQQAVRAQFRYQSTNAACASGAYNDRDDLVFAVSPAAGCTVNADCDDGAFCNGAETCNTGTGQCEAGTAPTCDDGAFCNGTETCNEATDSCDAGTAPACDDGAFCNGTETCNEATDSCDAGTAPACDNGAFCDGTETCNESTDSCDSGTAPCDPGTETCNESTDTCELIGCTSNAQCDDGAFCNGAETCNVGTGVCNAGTPPVCNNGAFCDGTETCNEATDSCDAGTPPACDDGAFCNGTETCNEATDSCDAGTPPVCDNGEFCDGLETCNEGNDSCDAGTAPCSGGQTCNETSDICEGGGGDPTLWMSFRSNTAVPGVGTVTDDDIVSYNEVTGTWALEFDGSDVGLGGLEISALGILPNGNLLLSFTAAGTVGGLSVDDSDIVEFAPTSLGSTTAGTFSVYFDGSDVALTSNGEDVDGIAFDSGGGLIISTTGGFSGTGASGADEDLFLFTGTLGSTTSGSFTQLFDGSDVGLGGNGAEDVDAAAFTAGGELLFSTVGNFSVTGLTGADEDIVEFTGSFGTTTSGTFSMRQDLSALGIASGEDIGSMHLFE